MSETKVFTAQEAFETSYAVDPYKRKKELEKAFQYIREYASKGRTACVFAGAAYDVGLLYSELPKYGYSVKRCGYGFIVVNWSSQNAMIPCHDTNIDPDKKYILPMEGTDWIDKGVRHYATIHENYWEPLKWTGGVLPPYGPLYEVQGRDILDAPDWVKAIKPIEVKE